MYQSGLHNSITKNNTEKGFTIEVRQYEIMGVV